MQMSSLSFSTTLGPSTNTKPDTLTPDNHPPLAFIASIDSMAAMAFMASTSQEHASTLQLFPLPLPTTDGQTLTWKLPLILSSPLYCTTPSMDSHRTLPYLPTLLHSLLLLIPCFSPPCSIGWGPPLRRGRTPTAYLARMWYVLSFDMNPP